MTDEQDKAMVEAIAAMPFTLWPMGQHVSILEWRTAKAILFSYGVPVAIRQGSTWFISTSNYCAMTTKHVNTYAPNATKLPHVEYCDLLRETMTGKAE